MVGIDTTREESRPNIPVSMNEEAQVGTERVESAPKSSASFSSRPQQVLITEVPGYIGAKRTSLDKNAMLHKCEIFRDSEVEVSEKKTWQ